MAETWSFGFRVSSTQDFETRYQEVLSGQVIPSDCSADVQQAHDMALSWITNYAFQKPYAVYLRGSHNLETTPAVTVAVSVQDSP